MGDFFDFFLHAETPDLLQEGKFKRDARVAKKEDFLFPTLEMVNDVQARTRGGLEDAISARVWPRAQEMVRWYLATDELGDNSEVLWKMMSFLGALSSIYCSSKYAEAIKEDNLTDEEKMVVRTALEGMLGAALMTWNEWVSTMFPNTESLKVTCDLIVRPA